MAHLLRALLKLVVQLVLFAATGRWFSLESEPRPELSEPPRAPGPRPPRVPRPPRPGGPRSRPRAPSVREEPSIEPLGGELLLIGGELAAPIFQAKTARRRARPRVAPPGSGAPPGPRSLAAAMRDRRVIRDAVILNAALGPRPSRR